MEKVNKENVKDHDAFADSIVDVTVGLVNTGKPTTVNSDTSADILPVKDSPQQESN